LRINFIERIYKPDKNRIDNKSYMYKNNAKYIGSWRGGFRDGKGKMMWPDGATYEGD